MQNVLSRQPITSDENVVFTYHSGLLKATSPNSPTTGMQTVHLYNLLKLEFP